MNTNINTDNISVVSPMDAVEELLKSTFHKKVTQSTTTARLRHQINSWIVSNNVLSSPKETRDCLMLSSQPSLDVYAFTETLFAELANSTEPKKLNQLLKDMVEKIQKESSGIQKDSLFNFIYQYKELDLYENETFPLEHPSWLKSAIRAQRTENQRVEDKYDLIMVISGAITCGLISIYALKGFSLLGSMVTFVTFCILLYTINERYYTII